MDDKWEEVVTEWKKTRSTKALYFDTVKKSFIFITNFCLKNNISLDKYKKDYAIRHIREKKVDEAVAVYLKFFEKSKLNKIQKILLQDYLSKYNNIVVRIRDPELDSILANSTQEMKNVLSVCAANANFSNQSSTK
jgi:ribosomal protein L22